ncbi:glycogen synthase [Candidatus Bathyarchaeota archaeon]|nr:glycogen synthase [Candidatus Bathyarchaeota archaeon]
MKVTFLTWEYPPHVYGGAGVHVQNLVQNLKNQIKIEIRTILPEGSEAAEIEEVGAVKILRYPQWELLKSGAQFSTVLSTFSTDLAMVKDPIDGQITHTHTWYAGLAGYYAKQLYDQRLIVTVHSLEPKRPWKAQTLGNSYRLSAWAEKTGLEVCDRIIAVSHADERDIIECFDVPPDKIKVIPNGVDAEAFHHHEDHSILKKYGVKKPYILFLGRLSRQKGIFDLISAVPKLLQETEVVLATGAPDEAGLTEELGRKLEDSQKIIWINKMLPINEVIPLLSGASVFVAPSIYEPFGIMNLEAMACARPVVSTRVGGIVDVVLDGQTGLLVSPGKPEELAEAVNRILSNPTLGERMGKAGRTRVETLFTWKKVAEDTLSLYQEIVR